MTQDINLKTGGFNFSKFQSDALEQLKQGKPLMGGDGVLTPLIKQLIEASLEGEIGECLFNCVNPLII